MPMAISFEDKAASWIDRLKGLDVSRNERVRVLEKLLLSLAQMMDGRPERIEWADDSFVRVK